MRYSENFQGLFSCQTQEVGNTAAFLLSDNSLGITAETIYIDGGFNALACCVDQTASENA